MRLEIITLLTLLLAVAALPVASGLACTVLGPYGPEGDYDCDGFPDHLDNCPSTENSQQLDMNRNGVGDICDLAIEEVLTSNDRQLKQGEFAHMTLRLINNRDHPVEDITVTAKNARLQMFERKSLGYLPAGEQTVLDFWLKVPSCAPTEEYEVQFTTVVTDKYSGSVFTEVSSESIEVQPGNCGQEGGLDSTIINLRQSVSLDKGETALFPVTFTNLGESQETYHLAVNNPSPWATWRVDPTSSLQLAAGHEGTLYLYLETQQYAEAGHHQVVVTVTTEDQTTTIPVDVYIRVPFTRQKSLTPYILQILTIIILLFLIAAAIIITVARLGKEQQAKEPKPVAVKRTTRKKATTEKKTKKKVAVEPADKEFRTHY